MNLRFSLAKLFARGRNAYALRECRASPRASQSKVAEGETRRMVKNELPGMGLKSGKDEKLPHFPGLRCAAGEGKAAGDQSGLRYTYIGDLFRVGGTAIA
jgi:hypothetical protein